MHNNNLLNHSCGSKQQVPLLNMQLKSGKMNNITVDDLPQRVGDMHNILLGISRELSNIKQIMTIESEKLSGCKESEKQSISELSGILAVSKHLPG